MKKHYRIEQDAGILIHRTLEFLWSNSIDLRREQYPALRVQQSLTVKRQGEAALRQTSPSF